MGGIKVSGTFSGGSKGVLDGIELVISLVLTTKNEITGFADLLDAIDLYLPGRGVAIVIMDNSADDDYHENLAQLVDNNTRVHILRNDHMANHLGGLWYSISKIMRWSLDSFPFKYLLKLDPDSLITGFGLIDDFRLALEHNPNAGAFGSYRYDCNNKPREFGLWKKTFDLEMQIWDPYLQELENTDYVLGEHCQGGAVLYARRSLEVLAERDLLVNEAFRTSRLGEDVIFSLLLRYCGLDIVSFVDEGMPFAISYIGLPMSIWALRRRNKKVIHALKFGFFDRIRRFLFRKLRARDRLSRSG